ncbi:MAG: hypothetical protein ACFB4J_13630 [Elainellaceae cyanobacterium]
MAWRFWKVFQPEYAGSGVIDEEKMQRLVKLISIARARAKIQNEYKLFQASPEVAEHRRELEKNERNTQLSDKPSGISTISFYVDESSKTSRYVIVGGICTLSENSFYKLITSLVTWKAKNNISYEFHFAKLTRNKLDKYKEFFYFGSQSFGCFWI